MCLPRVHKVKVLGLVPSLLEIFSVSHKGHPNEFLSEIKLHPWIKRVYSEEQAYQWEVYTWIFSNEGGNCSFQHWWSDLTLIERLSTARRRWCMPLITALWRQKQNDLCEFEDSLVYKASSRMARIATQRNPVLKNQPNKDDSVWREWRNVSRCRKAG